MLLDVKELAYNLEHKPVLNGVEFTLSSAGITSILGANGSGKSTLLSLIAGLLQPEAGTILFEGKKVLGPAYRLVPGHPSIALVRQDLRLTPFATVSENLGHALRVYDEAHQKVKIEELSELLGLGPNLDRVVKFLSGGEQQRVAIAAALATEPQLLLMDEPFSQTDMDFKQQLKQYLRGIVEKLQVSLLFVTHDPQEALALSDEILVLHDGKIVEKGAPKELYYNPQNRITALLTGYCNWVPTALFPKAPAIEGKALIRSNQVLLHTRPIPEGMEAEVEWVEFGGFYKSVGIYLKEPKLTMHATIGSAEKIEKGQRVWAIIELS